MNANIARTALLSALTDAASVRDRNPTNPIFNAVHITADAAGITVLAQSTGASVKVRAVGNGLGSACFNPDTLINWLKACSDEVVMLVPGRRDDDVEARCGKAKMNIAGVPENSYPMPQVQTDDDRFVITVPSAAFCDRMSRVGKCAAEGGNVYDPTSIRLFVDGDKLYAASTNRKNYAKMSVSGVTVVSGTPFRVAIPEASSALAAKVIGSADVPMKCTISKRYMVLDTGDVRFMARFQEYDASSLDGIIKLDPRFDVTMDRAELSSALKRMATMRTEKGKSLDVRATVGGDSTSLYVFNRAGTGDAISDEVPFGHGETDTFVTGFNIGWMLDGLGLFDSEKVTMRFGNRTAEDGGKLAPIVVIDEAEPDTLFLLAPVIADAGPS